jgi:hypothetical protein
VALAAAFSIPALAADAPTAVKHYAYEFHIDTDLLVADASAAMKDAEQWRLYGEHMSEWAKAFNNEMQGSMAYMFSDRVGRGRLVKGAPYSADAVTEMNQTLSDGNVITHKTLARVYRDGEGRTRQESFRGDQLRSVFISDPVAGMSYTLMPNSKTAISIPRFEHGSHAAPRAPRASSSSSSSETRSQDGERKIIVRTVDGTDLPGTREEVRVQVVRIGDNELVSPPTPPTPPRPPAPGAAPVPPVPPLPPIPSIPGVHNMRFESTASLGKGVTTKLGTRDFDGVKAEGTQTVWTIQAGQIGNRNPILVTKENWYSPELQVTVMTRHNDPRTGESIYRLAGLKRAEPSIDLFKVPEGYTLKGHKRGTTPEAEQRKAPG